MVSGTGQRRRSTERSCQGLSSSPTMVSGGRGYKGTPVDLQLVAITVASAQRLPGAQLLRAHPLPVIQVVHVAVKYRLRVRPQELHYQGFSPGK